MKKTTIALVLIVIVVVSSAFLLIAKPWKVPPVSPVNNYDVFAKCLTDKGVKMYGAFWCPHCQNQKAMFGDSVKYMPYIECSNSAGTGQTAVCADAGIDQYPTWVLANNTRFVGELSFTQLSELSGCPLP